MNQSELGHIFLRNLSVLSVLIAVRRLLSIPSPTRNTNTPIFLFQIASGFHFGQYFQTSALAGLPTIPLRSNLPYFRFRSKKNFLLTFESSSTFGATKCLLQDFMVPIVFASKESRIEKWNISFPTTSIDPVNKF